MAEVRALDSVHDQPAWHPVQCPGQRHGRAQPRGHGSWRRRSASGGRLGATGPASRRAGAACPAWPHRRPPRRSRWQSRHRSTPRAGSSPRRRSARATTPAGIASRTAASTKHGRSGPVVGAVLVAHADDDDPAARKSAADLSCAIDRQGQEVGGAGDARVVVADRALARAGERLVVKLSRACTNCARSCSIAA